MKPAIVPSSFPPRVGGVEEVCLQLTRQLRIKGHEPAVLTNRWPKELPAYSTVEGIPVWRYQFRVPEPRPRHLGGWLLHGSATQRAVRRRLLTQSCDVVNIHCVSSNGRYALAAAQALRLPLVVSLHGELTGDEDNVYERSAQLRRTWTRLMRAAHAVTAPSRHTLEAAESALGEALGDRGHVIRNSVDLDVFHVPAGDASREPLILAVGRLVNVKGFDVAVRALAQVQQAAPGVRLVIVGDGPERAALQGLAHACAAGMVTFTGALGRGDVSDYMRRAAVCVVPSRNEALGLTALEAMACGTPVVASDVGGLPEVVSHGGTGLLVPPDDPEALAGALLDVLTAPDASRARATQALSQARRWSWGSCAGAYEDVYERAIRDRRDAL